MRLEILPLVWGRRGREPRAEDGNVTRTPPIDQLAKAGARRIRRLGFAFRIHRTKGRFGGSADYWDNRYRVGSDSGAGSYGRTAIRKAAFVNGFVAEHGVQSVIEFGCGDGNQLTLSHYPRYLGLDVSREAVRTCRERFAADATKEFKLVDEYAGERADLGLSLDVIFHLVEDAVFEEYMERLFNAAEHYVIVFSTNTNRHTPIDRAHVRHRRFTDWAGEREDWRLVHGSRASSPRRRASFFTYERA